MLKAGIVKALGTMSGTSLDGVDAAVIETDGDIITAFGPSGYIAYSEADQRLLRGHLGRWQNDDVIQAAQTVEDTHIQLMKRFDGADIAGFHGQTLAHDPARGRTHQCGDGQRIADMIGVPVAWDFRTEDVAQGGEGAPLAPFFHFALAKWIGATAPIAFLNLGGVGNITFVNPLADDPAASDALLAFDTGPANAPINDLMQSKFNASYDVDGHIAAMGKVDADIITRFLAGPYFRKRPPKSLDRDDFAGLVDAVQGLADQDAVATLTQAVVASVADAMTHCPQPPHSVYVCGGGRKNNTLMAGLRAALACPVYAVEHVGIDGDMLEAQAFAYLAVRVARGLPISAPMTTGVRVPMTGGRLAFPATQVMSG
ncbi:anhydro-N-acetylmuramic acid kinase [Loktanella sp. S4079]|uniref:anhydro-N-acetylmuramic acid kinase n=1 Tax=Loktanella sp. S4079 TaxID=579483 RepID=UPI0005FA398D|nr:anhydro-N-acetylmuramic acid kinase [Loktanella sp. S4079]KJZ19994.1 anhydro-N-acetylmuramic acid kinase [Loktanella sp. S4079]